jgi:hypothetical protein
LFFEPGEHKGTGAMPVLDRAHVAALSWRDPERKVATTAAFRVSFHPLHVFHVIGQVAP